MILDSRDINTNYTKFITLVTHHLNQHIPVQTIKIKPQRKKGWLTKGLKKSCTHKRALKTILNETNNDIIKTYYKKYSKTLKSSVKISKKLEYTRKMKKSDNKVKTMWHIINEKTGKPRINSQKNISLNINNSTIRCPSTVSNIFNDYFATIGHKQNATSLNIPTGHPTINPPTCSMFLRPVDQQEIIKIIKLLKNKHSCGVDDIPSHLLKQCTKEFSLPLTLLVNQSFHSGHFPDLLKISLVKPIHKKDDTSILNNYRPIALLPTFSKVFEKAMCTQLYAFLEKFNILDEAQNGFRKSRSTTLAVYKYIQTSLQHINDKKHVIGLLLDMTKAYDRVLYDILLDKLYGVEFEDLHTNGSNHI